MQKPAAFRATYSDFKLIRTRKVSQFIFEVPVEQTDQALAVLGGMPNPAAEVWCGIALLQEPGGSRTPVGRQGGSEGGVAAIAEPASPRASKKSWSDMSPAQQAGVLCNERSFRHFLYENHAYGCVTTDDAAEAVRELCGVKSRSEILPNTKADEIWRGLVADYRVWERALV